MIKTKKELRFYIQEDRKRNGQDRGRIRYLMSLMAGSEQAHAFKYLKCLRHEEYHINNKGFLHKLLAAYFHVRLGRMGLRYCITIHPNICGYGLKIMHLSTQKLILLLL